jgi:hypothetical protein
MFLKAEWFQFVDSCSTHYSMVHHWVLTTKFQDELLSLIANHESKWKCQVVGLPSCCALESFRIQKIGCIVLVVSISKNLGMAKWDFNFGVRVVKLMDYKPKIQWSTLIQGKGCVNCHFLGVGGDERVTCGLSLFSSSWHYRNPRSEKKKKSFCEICHFTF